MNPREAGAAAIHRLRAELAADRATLARRAAELDAFLADDSASPEARGAATALTLDRTYTALEALLERSIRALEGDFAHAPDWHRNLLAAARMAVPSVRPAILERSAPAAADLDAFDAFLAAMAAALEKP